jgi:hypothetical protein
MGTYWKRSVRIGITAGLSFGAILGLVGCGEELAGDGQLAQGEAKQSENGLTSNGLILNGLTSNGLTSNGLTSNGLTSNGLVVNGLTSNGLTSNGLSGVKSTSGLMTTSDGRQLVQYIIKCALPSGSQLVAHDQNGSPYTYPGLLGVAPEWQTSACSTDCQERISACVLAHVNNAGVHIALWITSEGNIGWGTSSSYPYEEGSFFGNFFGVPHGYYCTGKDFYDGSVPGRLGAKIAGADVYVNPYAGDGKLSCAASNQCSEHSDKSGYDSCNYNGYTWKHVVTTWRNYDPNTNYKICSYGYGSGGSGSECLGVVNSSTSSGAKIEIRQFNNGNQMKWKITMPATGKYQIANLNSGMALDVDSSGNIIQNSANTGDSGQQMYITSMSNRSSPEYGRNLLNPASNGSTSFWTSTLSDGALVSLAAVSSANSPPDSMKWVISPL